MADQCVHLRSNDRNDTVIADKQVARAMAEVMGVNANNGPPRTSPHGEEKPPKQAVLLLSSPLLVDRWPPFRADHPRLGTRMAKAVEAKIRAGAHVIRPKPLLTIGDVAAIDAGRNDIPLVDVALVIVGPIAAVAVVSIGL